jgi:hypothetical protein
MIELLLWVLFFGLLTGLVVYSVLVITDDELKNRSK